MAKAWLMELDAEATRAADRFAPEGGLRWSAAYGAACDLIKARFRARLGPAHPAQHTPLATFRNVELAAPELSAGLRAELVAAGLIPQAPAR